MYRSIKTALLVLIGVLLVMLAILHWWVPRGPLDGTGIRFDGYYREETGQVVYLLRFFPEGNVVLANGTLDVEEQLPGMLVHNAIPEPRIGHYNVPLRVVDDSLFFTTTPTRGEISYRGKVLDGSRLLFERHSHINGEKRIKEYSFRPDASAAQ